MKSLIAVILVLLSISANAAMLASSQTFSSTALVVNTSQIGYKFPLTVSVYPASGDTAKVEYSTTPGAAANPGAANWTVSATLGAVAYGSTTNRETLPSAVTAIRFTTTAGAGTDTAELAWSY